MALQDASNLDGILSNPTAAELRKLNIARLKAEIAEAERAGNQAEDEEQQMWQQYKEDERQRAELSENRRKVTQTELC